MSFGETWLVTFLVKIILMKYRIYFEFWTRKQFMIEYWIFQYFKPGIEIMSSEKKAKSLGPENRDWILVDNLPPRRLVMDKSFPLYPKSESICSLFHLVFLFSLFPFTFEGVFPLSFASLFIFIYLLLQLLFKWIEIIII